MIVGAAWKKKDKNGNTYLSVSLDMGVLGTRHVAIFPVKAEDKKNENYPDYRVVWTSPEEKAKEAKANSTDSPVNSTTSPFDDDHIPY